MYRVRSSSIIRFSLLEHPAEKVDSLQRHDDVVLADLEGNTPHAVVHTRSHLNESLVREVAADAAELAGAHHRHLSSASELAVRVMHVGHGEVLGLVSRGETG